MPLYMLSSVKYYDSTHDYGDCIIAIGNRQALIYDCGSEEHAIRALQLLRENNITTATAVLSHNDDDHASGFIYLIEHNVIDNFITIDIENHKKDILYKIHDGRKSDDSISSQIEKLYDNISGIADYITIRDIYSSEHLLPSFAKFEGPSYEYLVSAAAQGCNTLKENGFDNTTFTNAPSIQLTILLGNNKILLTGDCASDAISDEINLNSYSHIQLPHHGNPDVANAIFERIDGNGFNNGIVYLVSDNKGDANGGSSKLETKGRNIKNTAINEIMISDDYSVESIRQPAKRLGL